MVWLNPYKERILQELSVDNVNMKYGSLIYNIYYHNANGDFKTFFGLMKQFPRIEEDILHTLIQIVEKVDSQNSQ